MCPKVIHENTLFPTTKKITSNTAHKFIKEMNLYLCNSAKRAPNYIKNCTSPKGRCRKLKTKQSSKIKQGTYAIFRPGIHQRVKNMTKDPQKPPKINKLSSRTKTFSNLQNADEKMLSLNICFALLMLSKVEIKSSLYVYAQLSAPWTGQTEQTPQVSTSQAVALSKRKHSICTKTTVLQPTWRLNQNRLT